MSFSAIAVSSARTYHSRSEISFFSDDEDGLSVIIDTERLHIRSVRSTETEYDNYATLFDDRDIIEKFATGQPMDREEIQSRITNIWVKRWQDNDPYSGLTVFKNDTDAFLGHVVLGHTDQAGESELAYLFSRSYWGKGYGSEAITAVVKEYAPATIQEGYTLQGKPLEKIIATVRPDNPASSRILEKVGMHFVHAEKKYGFMRHHYSIDLGN